LWKTLSLRLVEDADRQRPLTGRFTAKPEMLCPFSFRSRSPLLRIPDRPRLCVRWGVLMVASIRVH
jgi:hypothetical protein